ncbi:S8 family anti-phage peptidase IteS [Massilia genomosp. 1]|uniref:S8 family serine peptidase n=1 Tax=Massilia genomosp. 1 TaxID=2609280 RepID=A0ABX0MMK6_9BURK|nr:S8 family anti-phage peptidase IteS [Massilia genomosp. 1]NHZ61248.1 S8 family serine peptidase [Massilia genomosp. 1]
MATQANRPVRGSATTSNPIAHVAYQTRDLSGVVTQGGGGKELVPVTDELRRALQASVGQAAAEITAEASAPDVPGVMVIRLRNIAVAKTHRPMKLIAEASMPPAGHGEINEMLVAVNPVSLGHLKELIGQRNTKAIRANLSAVDGFEAWNAQRRLPKFLRRLPMEEVLRTLCAVKRRLMIKVFSHYAAATTQLVVERLLQLLRGHELTFTTLDQRVGPPLFLVDMNDAMTPAALAAILQYQGIRHVRPEPMVLPAAASMPGLAVAPRFTTEPPAPDLPTVAVFDSGVDPASAPLGSWVTSRDVYVLPPDTDYVHGTAVASLIVDSAGLNGGHPYFPNAACRIHDVCGLEANGAPESDLIVRLRDALAKRPDIKVWNLSLGGIEVGDDEFSDFGRELDALSDAFGVLFVVAAGNYTIMPRRGWPAGSDVLADRITSPADSVRALTVGAVTHRDNVTSLVRTDEPAPYSRRGPGPVFTPKPDIVHVGGNADARMNSTDIGVHVLAPGNMINCGCGTSYAAPIAAAMAARTWHSLALPGRPYDVAVSPTMVKALLIHSAQLNSPERGMAERRYYGTGLPGDPMMVLYDSDSSFTMLFELDIVDTMKWRKAPYPIPPSLLHNGKLRGEVIMTVAYAPPLDPAAGAEYVRFNVDVGFGTFSPNPGGEPRFNGCVPAEGELGTTGLEEAQVEHGGKWSPVKVYRRRFPKGVAGDTWGLQATILRRAIEPQLAQPLRVVIAITLRALDDNPNVYGEGRTLLAASNWISQDLSLRVDVPVRT